MSVERSEKHVLIQGRGPTLEGRLGLPENARAIGVVCHPHTLFGGSMDNNVVHALCRTLADLDCGWLRFNFRGAGRSEGACDNGRGETHDLLAALDFATAKLPDAPLLLLGYSFGAAVALAALESPAIPDLRAVVAVSPPTVLDLDFYTFDAARQLLVLVGDGDDYADHQSLAEQAKPLDNVRFEICPGADHFWVGCEDWLAQRVSDYLAQQLR
ncbi:MAG: alpha/beta fold hydrolase [Candidatus Alcyoniella australis]|nr:alpha/beta fold hydrolase [Candidatus Alcyoniella australis]